MTEPESPTELPSAPEAASEDRWSTLAQAFAAYHYPLDNLSFVQRLVDTIGIDRYEGIRSRSYIRAIRRGPGRLVHIHFGYTGGLSESEILGALGDVDRGSWGDGREWWVVHPLNKLRDGGAGSASRNAPADYGVCPTCFLALPASGRCDTCEG